MDEVYTCTCGSQQFSIGEGIITCGNCGVIYYLQVVNDSNSWALEWPKKFNKRIREELLSDIVNEKEA